MTANRWVHYIRPRSKRSLCNLPVTLNLKATIQPDRVTCPNCQDVLNQPLEDA